MVKPALSASRSVAVLDWVAGHPGEEFTLSELSRATGINIPSLMAVLQSLTDAGYLARHATRKTYETGPALLALSLVVSSSQRSFDILDHELSALTNAVGIECFASVRVGEQIVVVADVGRPGSQSLAVRVGFRFPLMAPVGDVFMAWNSPGEVDAWIERADMAKAGAERDRLDEVLAKVRAQGFSMNHFRNAGFQPAVALEQLTERPRDRQRMASVKAAVARFSENWEVVRPRPGKRYDVSALSAPVFNWQGDVLMAIVVNGFKQIEGQELLAHAERLLQTTSLLTKHGGGKVPQELHGARG